jgi:ABC-type Fe3+ transport system permease subunit
MPTPLNAGQARGGRTGTAGRGTLRVLASTLPVVIGVVVAVFFLIRLVPGDPARANLGDQASDDAVADLRRELGLDQPLLTQFGDFLWNLLTRADTGDSLFYGISSRELVLSRAGLTLSLVAVAAVLTILIVVPLAILAATRRGSLTDHLVRIVPTVGLSMPIFWIGMLLALLFSHPAATGTGCAASCCPGCRSRSRSPRHSSGRCGRSWSRCSTPTSSPRRAPPACRDAACSACTSCATRPPPPCPCSG